MSILQVFVARAINRLLTLFFRNLSRWTSRYYSFRTLPKNVSLLSPRGTSPIPQTVLLMQGPLGEKDGAFVIETLTLYRKYWPEVSLVVSTWKGISPSLAGQLRLIPNLFLLENERPENSGCMNVNYQLTGTKKGLEFIRKNNLGSWVVKTRPDQRIYSATSLSFCHTLSTLFPVVGTSQKSRIIGVSLNTSKYRAYSFSDMFQFGHLDDMCEYWNAPLDSRTLDKNEMTRTIASGITLREMIEIKFPEVYLMTHYLQKLGHTPEIDLKKYYGFLKRRFVVINTTSLNLYWQKYSLSQDEAEYSLGRFWEARFSFEDWMILQTTDISQWQIDNTILDQTIN